MEVRAYQKNVRISPRKLRLVADAVRSLKPEAALVQLKFMNKHAAGQLHKVLHQAVNNAVNNRGLKVQDLTLKSLEIEAGPTLKRWRAVSRGRAHRILKRMSHIKIILESTADSLQTTAKKQHQRKTKTVSRSQKTKGGQKLIADRPQTTAETEKPKKVKTVVRSQKTVDKE
jgi:large subunit ribosomal protein L22